MTARLTYLRGLLYAAFMSTLAACGGQSGPPSMPPTEVGILEVKPSALALALEYAAQLRGVREVEVRARVSGILLKRLYLEGSPVKEGDLLFRIDPAPFRAEVARARAEVGVQEANYQQALHERDRVLQVYEQKLVSSRDRDNAIAGFESARAGVEAARASLNRAQLDLSYTDVRAPISGLTSREARSEGSLVEAGEDSSLLTHIVQSDRLYVQFSVSDSEAESLRAAQSANHEPLNVRVVDTQGNTLSEKAPIEFIAPSIGNGTGTVEVRATLTNENGRLIPGQVARARVEGVNVPGSLVIPKRALMHGMQGPFVWVVGADNKAQPRPVKLGVASGNNVAVSDGLQSGDRVVVEGILKVQPGVALKPTPINAMPAQNTQQAPATGPDPKEQAATKAAS
jgi:membrane fusion protein, multidrug efflux system